MDMFIGRSAKYAGLLLRTSSRHLPKVSPGPTRCLCHFDARRLNDNFYNTNLRWRIATGSNNFQSNFVASAIPLRNHVLDNGRIGYSTDTSKGSDKVPNEPATMPTAKQSIFQRMKQMTKDYWHILIPVHVATSICWISIFYTAAKNGVNVVGILESLNLSERYLDILRGSNAGHWAVTYALYKLFTPIRYTVTLGGTTMSIRYLNKWGYLKFKPRSTIKETQSTECATGHRENAKTGFKDQQQTEPPKT